MNRDFREFAGLRPDVAPLDDAVKRRMRSELFGDSAKVSADDSEPDLDGADYEVFEVRQLETSAPPSRSWRPILVAAAVLVIAGMAGVWALGRPGDGGDGEVVAAGTPGVEGPGGVLPLVGAHAWRDELPFFYTRSDDERIYTVWQHRLSTCMNDLGFTYVPVEFPANSYGLDYTSPLDRDVAQTLGYHQPPVDINDANPTAPSPEFTAALENTCSEQAWSETYGAVEDFINAVDAVTVDFDAAIGGWEQTPDGITTTAAWSDCMANAGYHYDSPDGPRVDYGDDPSIADVEIQTRLADLDCDLEVGLTVARSAYEEAAAQRWIADNEGRVAALVEQKHAYDEALTAMEASG